MVPAAFTVKHFIPTLTPAGVLQFSSGTNYLKLLQIPPLKGSVILKTALTSDTRHTLWGSIGDLCTWLATNLGVPITPCRFDNPPEKLTEFKKALYLLLKLYYKEYKSGIGKWRDR